MRKALLISGAAAAALMFATPSAKASIVYDNSTTYLGSVTADLGNVEIGDEIQLSGTDRQMEQFLFETFLSGNATGAERWRLTLYAMDGPGNRLPGTHLFDSGDQQFLDQNGSFKPGFSTQGVTDAAVALPANGDVTWTVTFSGLAPGVTAGLLYYDPPTVGSSLDDFWIHNQDGSWQLSDTTGIVDNFGAQLVAVPEPTTIALLAGGALFAGVARLRRKK